MTQNPKSDLNPPQTEKPQDPKPKDVPQNANANKEDPTRGMQGEDYNYGGASSGDTSDAKNDKPDEKVGAPVEKSGPTPKAKTPAGNHSSTEANWGNRSGTGMGGGIAAIEEAGKKPQDAKEQK